MSAAFERYIERQKLRGAVEKEREKRDEQQLKRLVRIVPKEAQGLQASTATGSTLWLMPGSSTAMPCL